MAKPLDEQTDEELEMALANGQLDERKAAIAKEILSRRWQSKSEEIKSSYGWFGRAAAAAPWRSWPLGGFLDEPERQADPTTSRGRAMTIVNGEWNEVIASPVL